MVRKCSLSLSIYIYMCVCVCVCTDYVMGICCIQTATSSCVDPGIDRFGPYYRSTSIADRLDRSTRLLTNVSSCATRFLNWFNMIILMIVLWLYKMTIIIINSVNFYGLYTMLWMNTLVTTCKSCKSCRLEFETHCVLFCYSVLLCKLTIITKWYSTRVQNRE